MAEGSDGRETLSQLPVGHAVALRLEAAGEDEGVIACALGIDPAGVAALLELAHAKLERLTPGKAAARPG
ncbi:hypothetical protein BH20ACT2_BH20ACT2_03770 [soil metagenome]